MDLECQVCLQLVVDPLRLDCCGKCICTTCWLSWDDVCEHKATCPTCRHLMPTLYKAYPESVVVRCVSRMRECGTGVCDNDMKIHEKSCGICMDEFKRVVCGQLDTLKKELVEAKALNVVYERTRKRKLDSESRFERENVELKRQLNVIHERDRRARRRMNKKM